MATDKYTELDKQLKEYRQQQIKANKNRQSLFRDYDRSTITTNIGDPTFEARSKEDQGFLSSLWDSAKQNVSDLWNSINYDMDTQAVDGKISEVNDAKQYQDDLDKIEEYRRLIDYRNGIQDYLFNDPNLSKRSVDETLRLKQQLEEANQQIQEYDKYFLGEGRTHPAIAQNMFDGTKMSMLERFNAQTYQAIKSGWNDHNVQLGLSKYGPLGSIIGGAIEGASQIITRPVGVVGEILGGAYNEAKDLVKNALSDEYSTSSQMQNYIKNLAKDDDVMLHKMYIGEDIVNYVSKDLSKKKDIAKTELQEKINDLKEAQDDLKYGRLFGVDGAYDYNAVSSEWKAGRQWYQEEGGFWDGLIHPFFAAQDIASSLDMMKYQIGAQGVDVLIKRLPAAFVRRVPGLGTALSMTDVAMGIGATIKSRQEETALEKIGALGQRVAQETMNNGGDLEKITERIKSAGKTMGLDTDSMTPDQIWQLGIALNVQTGDTAFEDAKRDAQKGINKLVNANNALGILDYAQMLPYMSYHADVTRNIKVFGDKVADNMYIGNKTLGQRLGTRLSPEAYRYAKDNPHLLEESVAAVDGYFASKINKASKKFLEKDMPQMALFTKHLAQYEGKKIRTLMGTAFSESVEEGVQNLLQSRYAKGAYDDYKKDVSMFDLNEFVQNPGLALTAVADYFGAGVWDADNGSEDLRKAMNIGFWSSLIQSRGQHALTNLAGASNENIRGLARQFYDDKVAVRILADQEKTLQDHTHVDMFYDRFRHGADWNSLFTSLNDLKEMLDTNRKPGESNEDYKARMEEANSNLVKKEFIEDDIKLMTATWSLFSDESIDKEFKDKGINKKDEKYRQFLRDGATALMDYHKTLELVKESTKNINAAQEDHIRLAEQILDESIPQEQLNRLVQENPKLANIIDRLRANYAKFKADFPTYLQNQFDSYISSIKTVDDFIEIVGKETLEQNLDDDIKNRRSKKTPKYKVQAKRLFEAKTEEDRKKRDELLRPKFDSENEESFVERLKKSKSAFVNNKAVRDLVKNRALPFDEGVTAYLSRIYDQDEEETQTLIKEAAANKNQMKDEMSFVIDQIRMLHNLKKRKALERNLAWAGDQAQILSEIRRITGLDVDPSKIQGWVDNYKDKLQKLKENEADFVGKDSDFEQYIGGNYEFDDEVAYNNTLSDHFVNSAILKAQGRVANAYRSLSENPTVLKDAIFGRSATGTSLDDIVNDYNAILNKRSTRSEAEQKIGVDDITDLEDMAQLSKQAAWKIINDRITEAENRKKIVHRSWEEEQEQEVVSRPEQPVEDEEEEEIQREEGVVVESQSSAEKELRKKFYHENGKKQDVAEEIKKRKERLKEEAEEEEEEKEPEEEVVEEVQHVDDTESVEEEDNGEESLEEETPDVAHPVDIEEQEYDTSDDDPANLVEPDVNVQNIEKALQDTVEQDEDEGIAQPEESIERTDAEIAEDTLEDDPSNQLDPSFLSQNEFGELEYDGEELPDDISDTVQDEIEMLDQADKAPVGIDEATDMGDAEKVEQTVGDPAPNLIWQTLFYAYDEEKTTIKLSVNGKAITEFNGKPLRPGAELSKKLSQKDWLKSVKAYFVVTESLQAKNTKNNKDAFTVALILEDKDASYACTYRQIGETISVSSKYVGRNKEPKVYHINSRQILKNKLLLQNMDIKKLLDFVGGIEKQEDDTNLYEKQLVDAYKLAVNAYARELYAQNYAQLHQNNPNAKDKAYKDWDSIQKKYSESDQEYADRKAKWDADHEQYTYMARRYFSKPDRIVFSDAAIDKEIDKLKQTRDEIIDAYLEKNGEDYVFPSTPHIDKVKPLHLAQNNGKINSIKTSGGLPIFRTITDPNASMDDIQKMLDDDQLVIGIGKGLRPVRGGQKYIIKYGFSRVADEEVLFEKGGLSGKLYLMVDGVDGKSRIPVMLSEEKFDVQYRQKNDGSIEQVPVNNTRKVVLCIDPQSKELLAGIKEKPSAAEVLLYMILGELNLPGFQSGQHRDRASDDEDALVSLFINASAKTMLETQPDPNSDLMQNLASKQLYYGVPPVKVRKKAGNGKTITVWEQGTGTKMFNIGLPELVEVERVGLDGKPVKVKRKVYRKHQFTKEQILEDDELRQRIVQAIATQMHWNTDDYTFGESASVDASKSVLGSLVRYLIEQNFKAGVFDKMTPQQILDHSVSIMGCPQLSFRIGDFYSIPESGATQMGDFKEATGSVLAWMIKSGRIKIDTGDNYFRDPYVFASGVKPSTKDPVKKISVGLSIPIQEKKTENKPVDVKPAIDQSQNQFYDEQKEQSQVSRLGKSTRGLSESGIGIPKTLAATKEKIKQWMDFLTGSTAKNKKFADRIDVEKNQILDMILFQQRDKEDICNFAESNDESGLGISEEDDDALEVWDAKLRNDQLDRFVDSYNKSHSDKISREDIEQGVLKAYGKMKSDEVEAVIVYKDKATGKVKALFDTINASTAQDKKPLPFEQRHYIVKAATGVFSRTKTRGKFEEKKARAWLSETLGIDQENVVVWDAVKNAHIDPELQGAVDAVTNVMTGTLIGTIGLNIQGDASVHYHEAWHYVNLLMHSEQERAELYKAYLNTHKGFAKKHPSNRDIEERMAEDFRKWVLLQEDMSIIGSVRRAFSNMLDFLRIFNKKAQYRNVFNKIIAGDYRENKVSQQNLAHFKKEWAEGAKFLGYYTPGVTQEQREGFEYISNHQQYFDASRAIAKKVIQNAGIHTEKDVRKMNHRKYDEIVQEVNEWIKNSEDLSTDDKNLLEDVMKNEQLVRRAITESFEELGLTAKIRTFKSYVKKTQDTEKNTPEDDFDKVSDEALDKEDSPDNTWDRFDLSISKKDNASIRTKLFMRQIPVLERSYDEEGNVTFTEKRDRFGLIETYSFKEAWNLIVDRLWQCESIDDRDKEGYKKTSLLGMIESLRASNEFYEALYRALQDIEGNKWEAIVLRSQIFSTINSNRPQVSYLRISNPLENDYQGDELEDSSFDDSEIVRNGAIADVEREWSIKNDNEEEISRNLPREWSKALTAHGLLDMDKEGNNVVSKPFAKALGKKLKDLRETFGKTYSKKDLGAQIDEMMDKVIEFYNDLAIPLDKDSLFVMLQMSTKKEKLTNTRMFNIMKEWFITEKKSKDKDVETQTLMQDTVPRMADAIIAAANASKTSITYDGDKRERQLDELFSNFREGTHIYKLAVAINTVHPSAKEFSIKSPNGDRIYPISQNSFVSDRVRKLSTSGPEFARSMREASKYCEVSILLDTAEKYTKPLDQVSHFKLNAFVGIKDMNRAKGADYFGITPMEDYIAKMIMTEDDQIILPTMADKKTWYSLSHKDMKLVHDAMLVMPYQDTLMEYVYKAYEAEHPKPTDSEYDKKGWEIDAKAWYRGLDIDNEQRRAIEKDATDAYVKQNRGISIMSYSDDTLTRFGRYMMAELDALIQYYSEKNIQRLIENPHMLLDNYHGKIYEDKDGKKKLSFSGNGGKFRYFYDIIKYTDKNQKEYNLNQRLQYLYELQKKIESGKVKNVASSDPLYKYIGTGSLGTTGETDGFELIREELRRIKEEHFKQGMFISDQIKQSINSMLIGLTKAELKKLSDKNSPYKMVREKNGKYLPYGIPTQLIRTYANKITKTLSDESSPISTTQGMDETLAQDALFSLIASYVANSAISTIEFEKVFSGDPAFYARKKSNVNPTIQIESEIELADGKVASEIIQVENLDDTYSDKIKRLGSTLSPGDEMRLNYTDEEVAKYPELQISDYTNMNVQDIKAQSTYKDYIESVFKKQLLIDYIRSIDSEKFDKLCDAQNLKFEEAIQRIYSDDDFFDKVYKEYEEIHKNIEKELASQMGPYDDITVSDAQVFVRPELYRKIRIGLGQWSYDDERAYQIIEGKGSKFKEGAQTGEWLADDELYKAVRKLELYPLKMSYFQNDPNKFAGAAIPMLNKMAVFPLFKFQATNDTGRKLYERMNRRGNELDMISFKSAVKVGGHQGAVKMSKDDASVEDQVCTIDELFDLESSNYINYDKNDISKKNGGYGSINHRNNGKFAPVQIQSLSNLRMQLNTESHAADSRNIGTQMFKLAFSNIIDEAKYNGKTGAFIKQDIIRIINELTEMGDTNIRTRFFTMNPDGTSGAVKMDELRSYIQTIIQNNGLGVSAEEIFGDGGVAACIASRQVFENSVTSLVDSEVVDIDMPGGTAIQQSVFGFVGHGNNTVRSQIGAYKINYNNGEELEWSLENNSMEVIMSINFFKSVLPSDVKKKSFVEQKQWLVDHDIIKGTKTSGEMSNPSPYGMGYRIPTQGMSSMFAFTVADVMPPLVGDLIIVPREFTAQTGSDFDVDKLFLATFSYKDGVKEQESDTNKTKGALTNSLLTHYLNLLTDEKNYANARASIDVLTNKLKKEFVNGVIRSAEKGYLPGFTELMPSFQIDKKREFSIGKEGIAPFALNVTNLSLTQLCHLTMRYEGNIAQYGFGALDQIYGRDGRRIADWLSAMVNAHVDVAKDPYIFDLNINHATYNYANFLLRAGMGMSTFTFLAQQSLKNIADEINNAGGIYGGNIDGSTPESELYKKRRAQCILHEYKSIYFALNNIKKRLTKDGKSTLSKEDAARLDNLIAFAENESKPNGKYSGKKEGKDAPTLSYNRSKVFDERIGERIIRKGKSSKDTDLIDFYEHQLACIRCFSEISEHAQAISSLVSASQIDTKKFGNTIRHQINFRNKMQHLYEDGVLWTINKPGFDSQFTKESGKGIDKKAAQREAIRRYFEESYLDDKFTRATNLIRDILKGQLFTATDEFESIFRTIFATINGGEADMYEKELSADKIDSMGNAIDNIMRFNAMFNGSMQLDQEAPEGSIDFTFGGNKEEIVKNWRRILFGDDNTPPLYRRLADLQKNLKNNKKKWDYFDIIDEKGELHNDLLDILVPQSPNNKFSIGRITLTTSLIDKDSQGRRKLMASFAQLLNSEVEEVRDIAMDLVFYAYYSSYDQNVVNSFFDLVPPQYRKQYDLSLAKALNLLNSNEEEDKASGHDIIYDGADVNKMMDIICRNYWYDDNVVPRYYPQDDTSDFPFTSSKPVYGTSQPYGSQFGFPRWVAIGNDNTVKHNPYFKIRIGNDTLLYRKIGVTRRISLKDGKPSGEMSIYAPIPKAGLHQNGIHQYEFYADYTTPSVFGDNRISTNFSHELVRKDIQDILTRINGVADRLFDVEVQFCDETIPSTFDKMNRETYTPLNTTAYEQSVNKVLLHPAAEIKDGVFQDPEQLGVRQANVVIELTSDGKTEFVSREEDKKKGIPEQHMDKIVTVNISKKLSGSLYDKIKTLLIDPNIINRRIYVKVGDKANISVTEEDIKEYLNVIGQNSKTAERLLKDTNVLNLAVKQYKVNKYLADIIKKLEKENPGEMYLDAAYYGNTSAAEAVQYVRLTEGDAVRAHVHISSYAQFKDPSKFDKLKWALDHRKEDFKVNDVKPAQDLIEDGIKAETKATEKAQKAIDNALDEMDNQQEDDLDSEDAMTLDIAVDDKEVVETPPIIKQINEENKDKAADQECGNVDWSDFGLDD